MIVDAIKLYSAEEASTGLIEFATMSLHHADQSQSYILEQGWGFDLDEIVPHLYGSYNQSRFVNMALKDRLIVLKIKLNPQHDPPVGPPETYSSLRANLYKMISPGRSGIVELRLMNGISPVSFIRGKVKKLEADIFSAQPTVQISIACDFPLFRSVDYINFLTDGVSTATVPAPTLVDNVSNAPHALDIGIKFTGTVANHLTIQGKWGTLEWPFRINRDSGSPFINNDELYIYNDGETKALYMIRSGSTTNLMDYLELGHVWPMIFPGVGDGTRLGFTSSLFTFLVLRHRYHYWGL